MLLASGLLVACSTRPRFSRLTIPRAAKAPVSAAPMRVTPVRARTMSGTVRVFEKHQLAMRDSIVRLALAQVGTRYEFGGTTPQQGFDCSGLVRYVFSELYLTPPRLAAKQARSGAPVQRDALRPGDLLTFGLGDSVTHVGIYVGNRMFVHASSVAGRVIVSPVDRPPSDLIRPLKGVRRLIAIYEPFEARLYSN